jgi:ABC-2 type transport system ATP-binding protein
MTKRVGASGTTIAAKGASEPTRDASDGPALTATDGPALTATQLGRRFDDRWAVRDINLEVRRGEVLGLLGPNGAGKTTTVRLLTALIKPSEGTATIDGLDVVERSDDVRARVGILTETPGLYDKLSATANLDFFGRLYRLERADRAERIERYLRLFDLWDRRDDVAGTFSKGMKQKLAIARALLHDPSVVFLDEPTAALDPEAAFVVREAIETLRRAGRTIVLATHNLDEADRLCDRIAFVRGGLLRVDSPAGLRGALGARGLTIRLGAPPTIGQVDAVRAVGGVSTASSNDGSLRIGVDDPESIAPAVVRALVAAGGDIVEVRPERTSLEQIYFEVMGVSPGADGIEDIV